MESLETWQVSKTATWAQQVPENKENITYAWPAPIHPTTLPPLAENIG